MRLKIAVSVVRFRPWAPNYVFFAGIRFCTIVLAGCFPAPDYDLVRSRSLGGSVDARGCSLRPFREGLNASVVGQYGRMGKAHERSLQVSGSLKRVLQSSLLDLRVISIRKPEAIMTMAMLGDNAFLLRGDLLILSGIGIDRHAVGNIYRGIENNALVRIEALLDLDLGAIVGGKLDVPQACFAVGNYSDA